MALPFVSFSEPIAAPKKKAAAKTPATAAKKAGPTHGELQRAFGLFDADGSGKISLTELKAVLMRSGPGLSPLSEEACEKIFNDIDLDQDGGVTVDELSQGWGRLCLGAHA